MTPQTLAKVLIPAALVLLAPLAAAADLTVTVSDIRAARGTLSVAVVDSEAGWDNQARPVAAQRINVAESAPQDGAIVLRFQLPAGTYAVQVMHDENDNGKLDANFLGIPTEGYGFSNNPQALRRAFFSEARFELGEAPTSIVVRLR